MFTRALVAFLLLPGMVAFLLPAAWLRQADGFRLAQPLGLLPLAVGVAGLLWCVRDFYVSGRGTLAPWSPPERLVVVGLYRYSRNPMYVSVALILLGWALAFGSTALALYALVVVTAFRYRVVLGEEPWLARAHGGEWARYAGRVPRWFW